jgi:hypothetical protein
VLTLADISTLSSTLGADVGEKDVYSGYTEIVLVIV